MKDLFESIRADKEFNLQTLTYQEIFDGIKSGVAEAISKYSKEPVCPDDLILNLERCSTKMAYGGDMNLYPKICLDIKGKFSVILTPFNIELLVVESRIRTYSCIELQDSLYAFMVREFPDCNYNVVYEKYFINMEKFIEQKEKDLFL